jgi:hypothetical protein
MDQIDAIVRLHGTDVALTLWPEWAWAITHLDKDMENRGRDLVRGDRRLRATGGRLWIHAGKTVGGGELSYADAWEAVIETAEHAGWRFDGVEQVFHRDEVQVPAPIGKARRHLLPISALVAVGRVAIVLGPRSRRTVWKVGGQYGHVLRDMSVMMPPIPCKGAQGLWSVRAARAA